MRRIILCLLSITAFNYAVKFNKFGIKFTALGPVEKYVLQYKIVPDLIPKSPKSLVQVKFKRNKFMFLGRNNLTSFDIKYQPSVTWYGTTPKKQYTLCMLSLDIPTRENSTGGQWLHWLVGNIPGNAVAKGETLAEYVGPGKYLEYGSGRHRQVIIVYSQQPRWIYRQIRLDTKSIEERSNFSLSEFALNNGLFKPIAINFFLAEYDNYKRIFYEELENEY